MGNRRTSLLKTRLGDWTSYSIARPWLGIETHIFVKEQGQTDIVGRYAPAVLPFDEGISTCR